VGGAFTLVPGLTQTFSVPANARVYVASNGGSVTNSGTANNGSILDVALSVDGGNPEVDSLPDFFQRMTAANAANVGGFEYWSMSGVVALAPGTHTVSIQSRLIAGSAATVSGDANSTLQGSLTILILKA
jgi:hypothetical protein